jgi:hypothetical protein
MLMAGKVVPLSPGDNERSAHIEGDELILTRFHERDRDVVALAADADDIEAFVHDCLAVGARALRAARTTTDVAVVEKAFGDMTQTFSRGLAEFAGEIDAKAKALLDAEGGELPKWLDEYKAELEELLGDTFDPDSKQSALAKIEEVMRKAARDQVQAVRTLINPDNEDSLLGRYRSEIVKTVEKEAGAVRKAVDELKTQLAVDGAKAEMLELTTSKGFTFEEKLERALIIVSSPHEDVVDRVGGSPGARGRKGDLKVTLNPADTGGQDACYVLEAKDSKLKLRDILKELDEAITNRGALAGIGVFAKPAQSPAAAPFQPYGNRALVTFDKDEGDDLALRLGCAWARWVARRQLVADMDRVDLERIGSRIEAARQALRTASTIGTALKTSKTKIDQALGHVATLVSDVESALDGIEDEIAA